MKIFAPFLSLALLALFALAAAARGALGDGLLAHLPLKKDLLDHSSNHLSVSVTGNVAIVEGAAQFGGSDWLQLPFIDLHERAFAIALWVKVTGRNPMYGLLEQRGAAGRNRWLHLMLRGSWQPFLGQSLNDAVSPAGLAPNEWTHLVFQHDGQRQQIWINGELIVARQGERYAGTSGATCVGRSPLWSNVPSKHFEGLMRDVRIYGRALSADEIVSLCGTNVATARGRSGLGRAATIEEVEVDPSVKIAHLGLPLLSIDGNQLTITGENGQSYDLEGAESLAGPWKLLTTLTSHGVPLRFNDATAPPAGRRYYRVNIRDNN